MPRWSPGSRTAAEPQRSWAPFRRDRSYATGPGETSRKGNGSNSPMNCGQRSWRHRRARTREPTPPFLFCGASLPPNSTGRRSGASSRWTRSIDGSPAPARSLAPFPRGSVRSEPRPPSPGRARTRRGRRSPIGIPCDGAPTDKSTALRWPKRRSTTGNSSCASTRVRGAFSSHPTRRVPSSSAYVRRSRRPPSRPCTRSGRNPWSDGSSTGPTKERATMCAARGPSRRSPSWQAPSPAGWSSDRPPAQGDTCSSP